MSRPQQSEREEHRHDKTAKEQTSSSPENCTKGQEGGGVMFRVLRRW